MAPHPQVPPDQLIDRAVRVFRAYFWIFALLGKLIGLLLLLGLGLLAFAWLVNHISPS